MARARERRSLLFLGACLLDLQTTRRNVTVEGRYRLRAVLGQGRYASVFEAYDFELERRVALSMLRREQRKDPRAFALRFFEEGARRVQLVHPHTVRVYDYGRTSDDTFFVASELVRARPLSLVLSGRGPLGPELAVQVCERVCQSLIEAHRLGIVHGHLSPDRVWLTGRGLNGIKVKGHGALGLRSAATPLWPAHAVRYAAPELLAEGAATPASDIYSVGLLLFELTTGRPGCSEDTSMRVALSQRLGGPCRSVWYERLCQTSPTLAAVVRRCLSHAPDERYENVEELREALLQELTVRAA